MHFSVKPFKLHSLHRGMPSWWASSNFNGANCNCAAVPSSMSFTPLQKSLWLFKTAPHAAARQSICRRRLKHHLWLVRCTLKGCALVVWPAGQMAPPVHTHRCHSLHQTMQSSYSHTDGSLQSQMLPRALEHCASPQQLQGDAMILFLWQDDIIGVAQFIDACLERIYTLAGPPVGDRHLISPEFAGKHVMILLLLHHLR